MRVLQSAEAFGIDTVNVGEVDNQTKVLFRGCWGDACPILGRAELQLAVEDLHKALSVVRSRSPATRMTMTPFTGASTTSATA